MKHTKITHFWEWFERHQKAFIDLEALTRTEQQYWLAELQGHLTACNRFLVPLLQWRGNGGSKCCQLIISATGRSSSFSIVDKLLKQAPSLREWEMIALVPPAGIDDRVGAMLQELQESIGKLWIDIRDMKRNAKAPLYVFVEDGAEFDFDVADKIRELVCLMLGERVYGVRFGGVKIELYGRVDEEELLHLVPLVHLPGYLT